LPDQGLALNFKFIKKINFGFEKKQKKLKIYES